MAFDGPRLRRDLVSTILQEDGVRCVDVHDPRRGSSFRLFDYEYSVALAFDGRPLAKVIPWVRLSTGLELTPEQLTAFAERLDQLGFLASDEAGTPEGVLAEMPALVPHPVAEAPQTPLQGFSQLVTVEAPVPVPEPPVTVEAPLPVPEPPVTVEAPLPVPEPPVTVETPLPVPEPPATVEAPLPVPEPPVTVETPLPVPEPPVTVETPLPVPEPPVTVEAPLPVPEPPATVEAPLPVPEPPATATGEEPTPPQAGTASTETPSSDTTPAAEPSTSQPDSPSQAELRLPIADATPLPVETYPAASTPVQEPSPVLPETRPSAVADETPLPSPAKTPPPLPEPRPAGRAPAAEATDSTSRPLPGGARVLTPGPRRIVTPPPIPTPPALVTPPPSASTTVRGGPWILYALFGTLAALAVGVLVVPLALDPHPPAAARARVLVAKPTAVLRWFDGTAPVEALPSQVLSFPAGGKVIRLASPGTPLRPGDVVAATDAARLLLADLARQQDRLAHLEEIAQGLQDTGDERRAAAARTKVELEAGLVEQTQRALSRVAVVAQASNQVEATLAILGQTVRAGAPAVRMPRAGWQANFELPRTLATRVRQQGLCAAAIEGRPVGCNLVPDAGDETHVVIELAPESVTAAGQPLRLARARLADAFVVPASALSRVGKSDRVLVVAPTGRAEVRNVTVADRTAADAVITQGLDAGDTVIIETSEPVGAGARVRITKAMRE